MERSKVMNLYEACWHEGDGLEKNAGVKLGVKRGV